MKTKPISAGIVTVIAALVLATGAMARPFVGGGIGGPRPGPGPGPGFGFGPQPILPRVVIPPPPYYYRNYPDSYYPDSYYDTDSTVVAVQRALKKQGYYDGPVDGEAGKATRVAILNFREDHGLASNSRIDRSLLRALGL